MTATGQDLCVGTAVDWDLFSGILDLVSTGLVVLDEGHRVVAVNAAARAALGADRPACDPAGGALSDLVGAAVAGDVRRAVDDAGRSGVPATGRWTPRPGVVLEWTWTPLAVRGEPRGACWLLRDVSSRLADRARLRRQNRVLAELVAMKAEFVGAVSHELRTPVTSIAALTDLVAGQQPAGPEADALDAIGRNARRLLSLVDNVTELARLEGGAPLQVQPGIDLARVATDSVAAWAGAAEEAGVGLAVDAAEPVAVPGDPAALRRLADAMIGLALAVAGRDQRVTVTVSRQRGEAVLAVPLLGHGGERLFTSSATTDSGVRHDSTGLMLCRAIVGRHRGRLTTATTGGTTMLAAAVPTDQPARSEVG